MPATDDALAGGRLTIDLDALAANWRTLAARAAGAETAGVVKADAYGLGLEPVARALARAGCRTFFVALPDEGLRLRAAVPGAAIYVLGGLLPDAAPAYAKGRLRPALGSMPEVAEWAAFAASHPAEPAALHIDTGMNRLGLAPAEAAALAADSRLAAIAPSLVMSHFACADDPAHPLNRRQRAAFGAVRGLFPGVRASLANSAGILLGADHHFDLVRPGIALYGGRASLAEDPLRTVVTAEARILQVRTAAAGETVGYGATQTLRRPTRIAVVATGYADGYHRRASPADGRRGARARLHERDAPLVGRVSMDLAAFDVTDIPQAARGDWIELFGPGVPVDEVAAHAETIGYELLTSLGRRYRRAYAGGGSLQA